MISIFQSFFFLIGRAILCLLITMIRVYRFLVSPLFPPCCRFRPSCSIYAIEALRVHGLFSGSFFILRRLLRCHPWSKHPHYDPIPRKELN